MTPLRARLAAAAPGLDDATLDALERAAVEALYGVSWNRKGVAHFGPLVRGEIRTLLSDPLKYSAHVYGASYAIDGFFDTEAAAREALEQAVMEAIKDD